MKAELLKAVIDAGLTENAALDLLQEAGAVSDLCLKLRDIAEADIPKAIGVLRLKLFRSPKTTKTQNV